jgi:hypothetical protein
MKWRKPHMLTPSNQISSRRKLSTLEATTTMIGVTAEAVLQFRTGFFYNGWVVLGLSFWRHW